MKLPGSEDDRLLAVWLHHSQPLKFPFGDLDGWPRAKQMLLDLWHGEKAFFSHWKGGEEN